jgi:magnesium chelatase family protein
MLDRIDLTVVVARARAAQRTRYGENGPASNAEADSRDVEMAADAYALAEQAMERLRLSPQGYYPRSGSSVIA